MRNAGIDVDDVPGALVAQALIDEEADGFRDVFGQHAAFQHRPLAVVLFQLVLADLVGGSAFLAPAAAPDPAAADHRIGTAARGRGRTRLPGRC